MTEVSPDCPWCGGNGVDMMTGEVCLACHQEAICEPPSSRARSRRQSQEHESSKVSFRHFVSEASKTSGQRRFRPVHFPTTSGRDEEPVKARSAPKVRFNEETVHLVLLPEEDGISSGEESSSEPRFSSEPSDEEIAEVGDLVEDAPTFNHGGS
mmetsp:Transcript_15181/g.32733  ORF Transcript_15181/g.32733 Transcript_15181/m.32733 type:complete len:154 (-) Transcript_15181:58-519(-)|eukprot:CAMPEP_0194772448 /NCGR_PEP_ID=MMETSP0323_2-20130528/52034_1 /TAXON_ID=2866 ORGANISM="Crypthecodinium cohnii, Strain Seligo" /NCGR_SAMPLE_ID=MMETSP0323_2 /ASSEMBLY_ACC=CAM_ASM_000346 /LENGTH=153 /DNA_ID=CAMNT_0039706981 /DNA_START=78 /DNA_END=539 /DNA_ORIENTATION=-